MTQVISAAFVSAKRFNRIGFAPKKGHLGVAEDLKSVLADIGRMDLWHRYQELPGLSRGSLLQLVVMARARATYRIERYLEICEQKPKLSANSKQRLMLGYVKRHVASQAGRPHPSTWINSRERALALPEICPGDEE